MPLDPAERSRWTRRREALRQARILILEDDPSVVMLLEWMLRREGYAHVLSTADPLKVGRLFEVFEPDLVLLDLHLPGRSGFSVLEELQQGLAEDAFLPVLVLTGDLSAETKERALSTGAKDFLAKPFERVEALLRIENLLETRFLHCRLAERNAVLERTVEERTRDLEAAQVEILERLTQAVELYDDETGQHTRRVGETSARIASTLGLPDREVELIRRAAPLHDVGKVGISDTILLKPGPLTPAEFDLVKTHTTIGARMLSGGGSELIQMAEQIALSHHERWNGGGYPQGLERDAIPLAARIVALADFSDALANDRPYRPAWRTDRITVEVRRQAGQHFDPEIVEAFFDSGLAPAPAPG